MTIQHVHNSILTACRSTSIVASLEYNSGHLAKFDSPFNSKFVIAFISSPLLAKLVKAY